MDTVKPDQIFSCLLASSPKCIIMNLSRNKGLQSPRSSTNLLPSSNIEQTPIQRPISKWLMIATDLSTRTSRKRILPIYFHRPCQTGLNFLTPSPRYQYRFNQKQKTSTSVKINKARFIGESSRPDPKSHFKAFSGRNRFFHEDFASDSDLLQTRYYRFHRTPLYALRPATAREFLES